MSTTPTTHPTRTPVTPEHFERLVTEVSALFVDRERYVRMMALALVARAHMFLVSLPGTGKSMLTRELVKRIDGATFFDVLCDKLEAKDLLFGPVSVPDLVEGRRKRAYERYAPGADFVFLDEIWRGSEAASNSLLQFVNERKYNDDGILVDVPLWSAFTASNEVPEPTNANLAAIYDRFHLRMWVDEVTSPEQMRQLLALDPPPANPDPLLTLDQVKEAHAEAMLIPVGPEVNDAFVDLQIRLRDAGVSVSGRRQRTALEIARAAAWLDGADKVGVQHLDFLQHYLWDQPEQITTVRRAVLEVSAPLRAEVLGVSDQIAAILVELRSNLEKPDSDERSAKFLEVKRRLRRAGHELHELESRGAGGAELDEAWRHLADTHRLNEVDGVGINPVNLDDIVAQARSGSFAPAV